MLELPPALLRRAPNRGCIHGVRQVPSGQMCAGIWPTAMQGHSADQRRIKHWDSSSGDARMGSKALPGHLRFSALQGTWRLRSSS